METAFCVLYCPKCLEEGLKPEIGSAKQTHCDIGSENFSCDTHGQLDMDFDYISRINDKYQKVLDMPRQFFRVSPNQEREYGRDD